MDGIEVALEGRAGRAPVLRQDRNGKPWATVEIAVGAPEEAEWVALAVFGDAASRLAGEIQKGDRLYAEGKLRLSRWKDQNSGEVRTKLQVSVTRLEILGRIGKRRGARRLRRQSGDNPGTENTHLPAPEDPLPF